MTVTNLLILISPYHAISYFQGFTNELKRVFDSWDVPELFFDAGYEVKHITIPPHSKHPVELPTIVFVQPESNIPVSSVHGFPSLNISSKDYVLDDFDIFHDPVSSSKVVEGNCLIMNTRVEVFSRWVMPECTDDAIFPRFHKMTNLRAVIGSPMEISTFTDFECDISNYQCNRDAEYTIKYTDEFDERTRVVFLVDAIDPVYVGGAVQE